MRTLNFDQTHGLYHRTVGMDAAGRKPKFWLGDNEAQAQNRVERLELLWHQIKEDHKQLPAEYPNWLETQICQKPERPLWDELTLAAARAIARGAISVGVPRSPAWSPLKYTNKLMDLQRRFGAVAWTPEEAEAEFQKIGAEIVRMEAQGEITQAQQQLALVAGQTAGQTFHQALDTYIAYLDKLPDKRGWYRTQKKQTIRLKENHADLLLAQVGQSQVEEWINFWRHRPVIKDKQIAATTARNEIIQLDMVLKWIDRSDQFRWELPRRFSDIKRKVIEEEHIVPQVETFSLDDLKALWTEATPLVRLEMALALNAGFKYAEIASLAFREIHLGTAYPGIVRVDRPEGVGDWIVRLRRKTRVYGEWRLWPVTVEAIRWAMRTRKHPAKGKDDTLLITRGGKTLDAPTASGNKSDKIYSSWRCLYKRVPEGTTYLPFKTVETTATDWLRHHHGGEVANLFTCHGKPVKNDTQLEVYSNKPFVRLFKALDELREYLRPVFEAVEKPFSGPAK
jgi:hypothetical protein